MRRLLASAILCALALAFAPLAASADDAPPAMKIDRARVVGPPVLDANAEEGIYIWLEDGWYMLAAATRLPFGTKEKHTRTFKVRIISTQPIQERLDAFKKTAGTPKWLELEVVAGARPSESSFKTEGTITIFKAAYEDGSPAPIFVGPLAKRAAKGVRIGRF